MATTYDQAYIKQYVDNFEFLYDQEVSGLAPTVRHGTQAGEMKFYDFIGETSGIETEERNPASPDIDVPHSRRRLTLRTWRWGKLIDDVDQIKMLKSPQSMYLRAAVAAYAKWTDELILSALGATVYTGKEGSTAVTNYAVGECRLIDGDGAEVTAGSAHSNTTETGLTLGKLALCKRLLDNANVPASGRHLVANHDQCTYLLGSTKATSGDFSTIMAIQGLANGTMKEYMGFQFHWLPPDRFTENATDTGCYQCYAYHQDAVLLAKGNGENATKDRIQESESRSFNVRLYQHRMLGALRLQGPGVVEILLKKSPAIDFTQS